MTRRISGYSEMSSFVPWNKIYVSRLRLAWLRFRECNARYGPARFEYPQVLAVKLAVVISIASEGTAARDRNPVTCRCAVKRSHSCSFISTEYSTILWNLYCVSLYFDPFVMISGTSYAGKSHRVVMQYRGRRRNQGCCGKTLRYSDPANISFVKWETRLINS